MKKAIFTLFAIIAVVSVKGQTLDEQFQELKENSETFKQYKVIDQTKLTEFWSVTLDSVSNLRQHIQQVESENQSKDTEITTLNTTLKTKDERIDELETQTSTIEVFGADLEKSTFIFISFFTAGSLIIVLAFLLYKFKDNNRIARAKVKEYEKLNEDFEEYKRTALEKQMKLRRDLQTERNKLEEARNM